MMRGWDGTKKRRIIVTTDGYIIADISDDVDRLLGKPTVVKGDWLSDIPNPSNLDVALSTRLKIDDFEFTKELGRIGIIKTAGGAIIDPSDVSDRAARLLGKIYGTQDVLQQRATTKELIVQIQHQGTEKDPTQIRTLTTSDEVTAAIKSTSLPVKTGAKGVTTISADGLQAGSGLTTFYTVPVGKTFYLSACWISGFSVSSSPSEGHLVLQTATMIIFYVNFCVAYAHDSLSITLSPPLPFPAGTVFSIGSSSADFKVRAGVIGWEE